MIFPPLPTHFLPCHGIPCDGVPCDGIFDAFFNGFFGECRRRKATARPLHSARSMRTPLVSHSYTGRLESAMSVEDPNGPPRPVRAVKPLRLSTLDRLEARFPAPPLILAAERRWAG